MQQLLSTDSFKIASSSVLKELAVSCDLTDLEEVMILIFWTLIVTEILEGTSIYKLYSYVSLNRVCLFASDSGNRGIEFTLYHWKICTFYFSFTSEQGHTFLIRDYSQSSLGAKVLSPRRFTIEQDFLFLISDFSIFVVWSRVANVFVRNRSRVSKTQRHTPLVNFNRVSPRPRLYSQLSLRRTPRRGRWQEHGILLATVWLPL